MRAPSSAVLPPAGARRFGQARPAASSDDAEPHTVTQGVVDNGGEAPTSGRRLAAQVAAMVGAPPIVGGQPEQSTGAGILGAGAEQAAPPPARFCRRCGNRMPDGKGVCPRCAMGLNVRR